MRRRLGISMAELPKGVTKEVRRGGSGVLELLLIDFDREGGDGYIRIEKDTSPALVNPEMLPVDCLRDYSSLTRGFQTNSKNHYHYVTDLFQANQVTQLAL